MKNEQVAEIFANKGTNGRSNNMFIEGAIVYSYGKHFKIAERLENDIILFNTDGYSTTTERHKSLVLRELNIYNGVNIIFLKDCDINNKKQQIGVNNREIETTKDKLIRVRKEDIKNSYNERIAELLAQNELLREMV